MYYLARTHARKQDGRIAPHERLIFFTDSLEMCIWFWILRQRLTKDCLPLDMRGLVSSWNHSHSRGEFRFLVYTVTTKRYVQVMFDSLQVDWIQDWQTGPVLPVGELGDRPGGQTGFDMSRKIVMTFYVNP